MRARGRLANLEASLPPQPSRLRPGTRHPRPPAPHPQLHLVTEGADRARSSPSRHRREHNRAGDGPASRLDWARVSPVDSSARRVASRPRTTLARSHACKPEVKLRACSPEAKSRACMPVCAPARAPCVSACARIRNRQAPRWQGRGASSPGITPPCDVSSFFSRKKNGEFQGGTRKFPGNPVISPPPSPTAVEAMATHQPFRILNRRGPAA